MLELKTLERLLCISRFHEAREDILKINGKTEFLRKNVRKNNVVFITKNKTNSGSRGGRRLSGSMSGLNSRMKSLEERISKFKGKSIAIIYSEE